MDAVEQMFSVRIAPWWWKDGDTRAEIPDEYPGRENAMRYAGHDFTVVEQSIRLDEDVAAGPIDGWKVLRNDKTGAILNIVKNSYTVVQNDTLWDIIDALAEQDNVKYETAGILDPGGDGKVLWVAARIDEPSEIPGDDSPIYPYIFVSTTHDGTGAAQAAASSVRIVCMNTHNMAEEESKRSGRRFVFRHTKNVHQRIDDAKAALRGARKQHSEFIDLAEELVELPVSDKGIELFVTEFIPEPEGDVVSNRVRNNIERDRDRVRSIFNSPTMAPGVRNTGYGLMEAGVEYLQHLRNTKGNEQVSILNRSLLKPEPLQKRLVPLIHKVAEEDAEKRGVQVAV